MAQETSKRGREFFFLIRVFFFVRVCQVSEALKRSLAEVANEGLLNSLLPYLIPSRKSGNSAAGPGGASVGLGVNKDPDAAGTDSTTGNASSTLAGAESSNQVTILQTLVNLKF